MPLRVLDLFCGTGAFSYGFAQTRRFVTIAGIDIKQPSIETFLANHPGALGIGDDIHNVRVRDLAERLGVGQRGLDVIVAGPPCQGFSSIRPYRSINEQDGRNNLFEQLLVFVDFFRPEFVVFENVVGLIKHQGGSVLTAIRESIESFNYVTCLKVLNAVHYGVPQKRERLILLARKGAKRPIMPEATHRYEGKTMAGPYAVPDGPLFSAARPPAITVEQAIEDLPPVGAGEHATSYLDGELCSSYARARRNDCAKLTLHASTRHTPRMLEIVRQAGTNRWALPEGLTTSGFSSCYSRLVASAPSTTITVNFVHPASNRCIHPTQDRALTPREGARLQSFDDDFVFRGSRTEIVKQIGEAIPPLLARSIAEALLRQW